jgi:hypothetical protein
VIALAMKQRPARVTKPKPHKYYGRVMRRDGSEITLVAKAFTEEGACRQLHDSYDIIMVIDLLTAEEVDAAKRRRYGSPTGVPRLL